MVKGDGEDEEHVSTGPIWRDISRNVRNRRSDGEQLGRQAEHRGHGSDVVGERGRELDVHQYVGDFDIDVVQLDSDELLDIGFRNFNMCQIWLEISRNSTETSVQFK